MQGLLRTAVVGMLVATALALPASALALGIPIGGKVTAVLPCPKGVPGYLYKVLGFGIGTGLFVYAPGTITFPWGPPIVGRWVLGLGDVPTPCGVRTQLEGTSPAI